MVTKYNRKKFNELVLELFPESEHTKILTSEEKNPIIITRLLGSTELTKLILLCNIYKSHPTVYCWDSVLMDAKKPNERLDYLVVLT